MTDLLIGVTIGATCTLGLSIAFVLMCLAWARSPLARRPDPVENFEGEVQ